MAMKQRCGVSRFHGLGRSMGARGFAKVDLAKGCSDFREGEVFLLSRGSSELYPTVVRVRRLDGPDPRTRPSDWTES